MAEQLIGYPVVRGEDGTLVGHDDDGDGDDDGSRSERGRDRAGAAVRLVRVRVAGADGAVDRRRLEALTLAAGPHVEPVLDAGTAVNGDVVLVLPALPVRLIELLAAPGWPTVGEAVTVLAPLLGTVARIHGAGIAHGDVAAAAVRLDPSGAPVLCGFESAVLRGGGVAAFEVAVERDLEGLAALADAVLRAGGAAPGPVTERIRRRELEGAVDALFDLAEPEPVRLAPQVPIVPVLGWPPARFGPPAPGEGDAAGPWGSGVPPVSAAERLLAALRTVRPRIWAVAASAVVLLAAALVLLPGRGADAIGPRVGDSASVEGHAAASPPGTAPPAGPVAPRAWAPARAAGALLRARASCLAAADAEACLGRVDADGSPVAIADRAAARAGVAAVLPEGGTPRLVSVHADTAVLDVGRIAVLAVREPGGWRLRDVVAPPA